MSVQIAIVCTTCGCTGVADEGADREPAHSLRAKLKGRGWAVGCYSMKDRSSTGGYDFCPPCIRDYVRIESGAAPGAVGQSQLVRRMTAPNITVREACRRRMDLGGADAQALEHALTITERERDAAVTAFHDATRIRSQMYTEREVARRIAVRLRDAAQRLLAFGFGDGGPSEEQARAADLGSAADGVPWQYDEEEV